MAREERRLAAIVQADVVGYARLIGRDEEGTLARLRALRTELIDPRINEHGGRIVKSMGDGLLLEFPSVVNAARCAINFQSAMATHNWDMDANDRIDWRIGINLGDVVVEGDDIQGDGVNVAARLEALAPPGGICLSRAARDQIRDRLKVAFEDLGEIEVKNIARPVQVFRVLLDESAVAPKKRLFTRKHRYGVAAVIAIAMAIYSYQIWFGNIIPDVEPAAVERMAHALPEKPSVAVLPFDNMSGGDEQDYFADGMVEDLITDLSKLSNLFVISRNSTFTYKGRAVKVQQVAEELGVRFVVEGSVRRAGETLRINVQLIDALSGHHVWAERYDGKMADVFALQDSITGKIVDALAVKLLPDEANRARGTDNPAAYDALLLGWKYLHQRRVDPRNYVLAREQFAKALSLDPDYSRAHLSMAAVYWWGSWNQEYLRLGVNYQEGFDRAQARLKTAMKSPSALGHRIQAEMYRDEGKYAAAVAEAKKAIRLDPNSPEGYGALASAQAIYGEPEKALQSLDIADRLDPENVDPNWVRRGIAHFFLRQNEQAARFFELAISSAPNFDWTYRWLISAYGHLDRKADAAKAIQKINALRAAKGTDKFTVAFGYGGMKVKRQTDRDYFREGLEKAGLEAGGDVNATKIALETILTRTETGGYVVKGATTVDAKDTNDLLAQGTKLFDMRGNASWQAGHIPGAIHGRKAIGELTRENLAAVADLNQPVSFYCSGFT